MNVEQIERQIERLPTDELRQFAEWFQAFLSARITDALAADVPNWQETPEILAELDRRLAEFEANPNLAAPFQPDYFDHLKRQLTDEQAQKTSAR